MYKGILAIVAILPIAIAATPTTARPLFSFAKPPTPA